jgi:hypothetical protein
VETMSFAYLASFVRVVYEDESWWQENGPTFENNFTFTMRLDEVIDLVHEKLPGNKHKHLYPQDANIIQFIRQTEQREREEKNSARPSHKRKNQSMINKLQAALGSAYGKIQLSNLLKLCIDTNKKDYSRICCLSQKGNESHQWLQVVPSDRSLTMRNQVIKQSIRYRLGLNPYDTVTPPICLCGKKDVYQHDPYHSLSCSALRYHGTNMRHHLLVKNIAEWIRRAGAITQIEVTGMSTKDKKRPDIVFWHDKRQYVIDVTVTDPFNATNTKKVGPITPIRNPRNNSSSSHFDSHAAQYKLIHSAMEKRKNKHYQELINANQSIFPTVFYTAGAFTTGGLCDEFRELITVISTIAQSERSGWNPADVVDGVRGAIAVAIQVGNAMVLNDSWNRIAFRNYNRLLRPEKERSKSVHMTCARKIETEMMRTNVQAPISLAA